MPDWLGTAASAFFQSRDIDMAGGAAPAMAAVVAHQTAAQRVDGDSSADACPAWRGPAARRHRALRAVFRVQQAAHLFDEVVGVLGLDADRARLVTSGSAIAALPRRRVM